MQQMKVASFDIFDTCLTRRCGTPSNMLDVLSRYVFSTKVDELTRQSFVSGRRLAETSLLSNKSASIYDIYASLTFRHTHLVELDRLPEIEMNCERMLLRPVRRTLEIIDSYREKGAQIIFISDMYLPSSFLKEILIGFGIFKDGDSLYVSCEEGCTKRSGLFEKVREKEKLSYKKWVHYGDHPVADKKYPVKLGIDARHLSYGYSAYPYKWMTGDCSLGYKSGSMLAGLVRSIQCESQPDSRISFLTDLSASFNCTWIWSVMEDACMRNIKDLYFCSRDALMAYRIAQRYQSSFPGITLHYLYISRESLYKDNDEAKLAYFVQEGLASNGGKSALVDLTTSGKTLKYLNSFLENNGYSSLYGYYFRLYDPVDEETEQYYLVKAFNPYMSLNPACSGIMTNLILFEHFMGMNLDKRTVDYEFGEDGHVHPVFASSDEDDYIVKDKTGYFSLQERISLSLADGIRDMGICNGSDVYQNVVIPSICSFFQ